VSDAPVPSPSLASAEPGGPEGHAGDEVWCVVVAAGSGARFGRPKQYDDLAGHRVLDRSVATAATVCDGVVVVVPPDAIGTAEAEVPGADVVVAGGATRTESGRAGLEAVPRGAGVVLVHDAARPLATADLYRRVVAVVRGGADAVVPVVPVVDTIRSLDGGVVDRDRLRAVQTPQGFRAATLRAAHVAGRGLGRDATDDAGLVEAEGVAVTLVEGEAGNLKITRPADLVVAAALLSIAPPPTMAPSTEGSAR